MKENFEVIDKLAKSLNSKLSREIIKLDELERPDLAALPDNTKPAKDCPSERRRDSELVAQFHHKVSEVSKFIRLDQRQERTRHCVLDTQFTTELGKLHQILSQATLTHAAIKKIAKILDMDAISKQPELLAKYDETLLKLTAQLETLKNDLPILKLEKQDLLPF